MEKKYVVSLIVIVAVIVLGFVLFKGNITGNTVVASSPEAIIDEREAIKIPLSSISNKAKFHSYDASGVDVEYFVVEADDGSIKTAFNACDVCYRAKKGYSQKGGDMVCNNCGNHYAISDLGTKNLKGGGCWPGYLPSKVEGEYLVIQKSDLEAGKYRF